MKKRVARHLHEAERIVDIETPSILKYQHWLFFTPLILPLIIALLKKHYTNLIITNKRVIIREGVIGEHSKSVTFDNLTTVKVNQSIRGRIFNYGYMHLHTQTGGHSDITFHYLKNPIKIKKEIEKGMYHLGSSKDN